MLPADTVLQDRYRIVAQIGKGGMGAVYQARDLRLRTDVALKETLFADETYRRAFEREAQILARLRHQALPRVIDHFVEGNGQFLVMEFIHGEDLGNQLVRFGKRFSTPQVLGMVLKWADQLLDVLHYLHTRPSPVFHRDIKPKNLKLINTNDIILLDFGLARGGVTISVGFDESGETTTPDRAERKVYGFTPPYAPFEQMRDGEPDPRSDLYSLAATLYHLLTGTLPTDAMGRMARMINGQPDSLRPIRDLAPHVPESIARLIEHSMAVLIDNRPSSAREMREELARLRGLRLARIQPPPPTNQPTSQPSSQPPATPAPQLVPPNTPSAAVPPTQNTARVETKPVGTLVRRLITGSPIRSISISPDGKLLAAGYDDHSIGLWSFPDGNQLNILRGHTSGVRCVAFSPKGDLLASASDDETVRLWDLESGISRRAVRLPTCPVESISFSPDGRSLAAGGWGSAVTIFQLDNERMEPVGSLPCPFVHSLAYNRQGNLVAAGCYDGCVYLWNTTTFEPEGTISGFANFIYSVAFSPDGDLLAASSHTMVRVWRVSDRRLVETLQGHSGPVRSITFSPDSSTLTTGSEDRSARMWRLSDGLQLPFAMDHSAGVASIAYSPDGRILACGTHDGRICLWQANQ